MIDNTINRLYNESLSDNCSVVNFKHYPAFQLQAWTQHVGQHYIYPYISDKTRPGALSLEQLLDH